MPAAASQLRLFAGFAPDPPVRTALAALQQAWCMALSAGDGGGGAGADDPGAIAGLRLVPAEDLHLTLRFFGSTPAASLAPLQALLAAAAATARPFEACLERLEYWPARNPRVVVAAFGAPAVLQALVARVEAGARGLGFAPEPRPFRAHVTLARGRGAPLPPADLPLPRVAFAARTLVLFESRTRAEGARYTPLATFPLSP